MVTSLLVPASLPPMQHSFIQKLILVIIAGAVTAGVFEFYKGFIVNSMEAVNGNQRPGRVVATPTPRRF